MEFEDRTDELLYFIGEAESKMLVEKIIGDSGFIQMLIEAGQEFEEEDKNLLKLWDLIVYVRRYDLLIRLYQNDYTFNMDELLLLCEYLCYLDNRRIVDIYILMASSEFKDEYAKKILDLPSGRVIIDGYVEFLNEEKLEKNLFLSACLNGCCELAIYVFEIEEKCKEFLNEGLSLAPLTGSICLVKYLLEKGADPNYNESRSLCNSVHTNNVECMEYLLTHGANIEADDDYAIRVSSNKGYLNILKLAVKYDGDIHVNNDIALRNAATYGYYEMAEYLIKLGARIDISLAIINAAKGGYYDICKLLIDNGANISIKSYSPLTTAIEYGHPSITKLFAELSPEIDRRSIITAMQNLLKMEQTPITKGKFHEIITETNEDVKTRTIETANYIISHYNLTTPELNNIKKNLPHIPNFLK